MRHLVAVTGALDGVHLGHQALIRQVLTIAERDRLILGVVAFDPHPQLVLHPERPFRSITLEREKGLLLHQMGIERVTIIPFTVSLSQMSAEEFLRTYLDEQLHIHTLVVGFDHHFGHDKELDFADYQMTAQHYGIRCICGEAYTLGDSMSQDPINSTAICRWINTGAVTEAERQLGYPYTILGKVKTGLQIGRKLGYPTANIEVPSPCKALPPAGVYMACTAIDPSGVTQQRDISSMLCVGTRPTLELAKEEMMIEVFLMGGEEYHLYGQELQISLCDRLRRELHFESLDALRKQITRNEEAVRRYLQPSD